MSYLAVHFVFQLLVYRGMKYVLEINFLNYKTLKINDWYLTPTLAEYCLYGVPVSALEFTPGFSGVSVTRSLVFCVMLCRSLIVLFLFAIVLYDLRCTASDYPFGIFKLFLKQVSEAIIQVVRLPEVGTGG